MKKFLYSLLIVIFVGVFAFAAWQLYKTIAEYEAGTSAYKGLEQYVSVKTPAAASPKEDSEENEETQEVEETAPAEMELPITVDFDALLELNADTTGWIYIEDTNINYPIVQAYDNLYYLHRLFDGTPNAAGCLFMDENCSGDFSGRNSVVYGHHMGNGSMFADLVKYKKQEFFDEHPEGLLLTPEGAYRVLFFSGYVIKSDGDAWIADFSEDGYAEWLEKIVERSSVECDIVPEITDRILTLSTCSYEFTNARYVLHGIIVDEESQTAISDEG